MKSSPEKGNAPEVAATGASSVKNQGFNQGVDMSNSKALTVAGTSVRQINGLYSLNDLHKASGGEAKHEPNQFSRLDQTQALIAEIKSADMRNCIETRRGNNGGTYACKELVIAYAAWISAAFHLKVLRVFLDANQPQASAIDYDRISPAQAQDLKQIVDAIVDAGIQSFGETWKRLQNKFKVNSYLQLPATRHLEARKYLIAKLPAGYAGEWLADEPDLEPVDLLNGHTVKNMRDVARDYLCAHGRAVKEGKNYITMDYTAPKALESVFVHALTSQRLFSWFDSASGKMQSKLIPADSVIFSPEQGSFEGLVESTSLERLPELMEAVNKRVANHLGVLRARMSQGNLGLER